MPKALKTIEDNTNLPFTILNAVGAGLSLIDRNMRIVWINMMLSKWFGKLEDIKGKLCYEVYQGRKKICPDCPSYRSFRSGKTETGEQVGTTVKGEKKDYLLTTSPIFSRNKKPQYVLELTQDITEQKELERKLRKSEETLKRIFENINAAIFVISPEYAFTYLNPRAHSLFSISSRLPIKCCDIFASRKKWMGCERCQLRECFNEKRTLYYEFSFNERSYSSMLTPIFDKDGVVSQLIEISLDITDFRDLQEKLKESEELATIGKITAGIAHEIRNPIFGISSITQLLAKKDFHKKERENLSEAMLFETERLNGFLEDLLILSSPKRMDLALKNPHILIDEVLASNKVMLREKLIKVDKSYGQAGIKFKMDGRQMKLLVQNLIDNAIEASNRNGKILINTTIAQTAGNKRFVLKIGNSGKHIRKDQLNLIFEPFFSTKAQGTGLGLSICKRIVKDLNGSISIRSSKKRTEFEVMIPILSN